MAESSINPLLPPPPRSDDRPIPPHDRDLIPTEMAWEILKWLPVKSLMRCKCVSRTWRSIIMNPLFARSYRGGFRGLLVVEPDFRRLAIGRHFFYVSLDGPSSQFSHQVSVGHGGTRMDFTNVVNGLVCFYSGTLSDLYNIATREKLRLPESVNEAQACSYHLGFDPVHKLYKLLKICPVYDNYNDDDSDEEADFVHNLNCEILTIGVDSSWRCMEPAPMEITTRSICIDGDLYWTEPRISYERRLIAFNLCEEKFQIIPIDEDDSCFNPPNFGPNLALTQVVIGRFREAWMIRYVKGNGEVSRRGKWVQERKFVVPVLEGYDFEPQGILPNGKVVIFDCQSGKDYPAPLYLFDPTTRKYEKIMIEATPSFDKLLDRDSVQGMFYIEENIMPLSYLNSNK